jgi:uncharacterized SAM-binding protein YcdF (DUF218 family)
MDTAVFIAGKLVGAMLRIETWLVALAVLSLLAQMRGRPGLARALTGALMAGLVALAVFPVGAVLLRPLEATFPANPPLAQVEGIILLGGAEDVAVSRQWGGAQLGAAGERLMAVAELARRFPAARVIVTGGSGRLRDAGGVTLSEAQISAGFLERHGVAASRILLEEQSRTTAENARRSLAEAQGAEGGAWVLVTSAYHMPRAMQSFRAAGWTGVVPYPVDHRSGPVVDGIGWDLARNLELSNIAVREWVGRLAYRILQR